MKKYLFTGGMTLALISVTWLVSNYGGSIAKTAVSFCWPPEPVASQPAQNIINSFQGEGTGWERERNSNGYVTAAVNKTGSLKVDDVYKDGDTTAVGIRVTNLVTGQRHTPLTATDLKMISKAKNDWVERLGQLELTAATVNLNGHANQDKTEVKVEVKDSKSIAAKVRDLEQEYLAKIRARLSGDSKPTANGAEALPMPTEGK